MGGNGICGFEFRKDGTGKLLAQFHTPLVKRVDPPDDPLSKYFVLIHGDKHSQSAGVKRVKRMLLVGRLPGKTFGEPRPPIPWCQGFFLAILFVPFRRISPP